MPGRKREAKTHPTPYTSKRWRPFATRSSVTIRHEISCKGQKRWDSTQVLAASDLDKHISIPWPDDVKAALEALVVPQAER